MLQHVCWHPFNRGDNMHWRLAATAVFSLDVFGASASAATSTDAPLDGAVATSLEPTVVTAEKQPEIPQNVVAAHLASSASASNDGSAQRGDVAQDTTGAASSTPSGPQPEQHLPVYTAPEVVVTAERRTENIQDVPLSVTAISGATLADFDNLSFDDYAHMVPNLSFGTGNTFGITNGREITIRGISGFDTTSYYINDTPLPIPIDPRAINLDRIEVLRGPQGTLFGSSAMGGTVRLITRQPDLDNGCGSADVQGYDITRAVPGTRLRQATICRSLTINWRSC
jgi:outer membrane receptor protein involved in Fe transport